jgi:hypothetical protein
MSRMGPLLFLFVVRGSRSAITVTVIVAAWRCSKSISTGCTVSLSVHSNCSVIVCVAVEVQCAWLHGYTGSCLQYNFLGTKCCHVPITFPSKAAFILKFTSHLQLRFVFFGMLLSEIQWIVLVLKSRIIWF